MIITFCGHSQFHKTEEYEKRLLSFLEERVRDESVDMYLGEYGEFDSFAYECCRKYKEKHPQVSLIFVTPYLINKQKQLEIESSKYDLILYPEIESKPKRFAISYRNRYMVEKADYVVAYITHDWGGAYKTYEYAKRKGKDIFNLADPIYKTK